MDQIIGHKSAVHFFEGAIAAAKLAHAYCLVGPAHVGKTTLTFALAAKLLNTTPEKIDGHLDTLILEQEINEKTGKTKKNIDIEQIRNVREFLRRHAAMGGYKIAIIKEAEKMNANASNALLKTLEEPTEKTVIFLLTEDEHALLPTIRSRCQIVQMNALSKETMQTAFPNANADQLAHAYGRPGLLTSWQKDPEAYQTFVKAFTEFSAMFGQPLYKKLEAIDELFGDKTDHIAAREELKKTLSIWQLSVREKMLAGVSTGQEVPLIDTIEETKQLLDKNIHPRLAVEHILLAMH